MSPSGSPGRPRLRSPAIERTSRRAAGGPTASASSRSPGPARRLGDRGSGAAARWRPRCGRRRWSGRPPWSTPADRRDDRFGVEDGEGGGHHLAGHLPHDRAPAREVGRAVGELHPAAERPRAGRETEPPRRRRGTPGRSRPDRPRARGPWRDAAWFALAHHVHPRPRRAPRIVSRCATRTGSTLAGLWRMRRTEVRGDDAGAGHDLRPGVRPSVGTAAGLTRALVVVALGCVVAWFVRRRYRPGATRSATRTCSSRAASWCSGSRSCPTGACSSSR